MSHNLGRLAYEGKLPELQARLKVAKPNDPKEFDGATPLGTGGASPLYSAAINGRPACLIGVQAGIVFTCQHHNARGNRPEYRQHTHSRHQQPPFGNAA